MAVKLFDVTLTQAQLQALTAGHFYYIDRLGNLQDAGTTIAANVAAPQPSDQASFDLSQYQAVTMYASHGVLTGAVTGKVSFAEFLPDFASPAVAPEVVGTTIDQALAVTAETVATPIVNPPTARRMSKGAIAISFGTVPTTASVMRITVWGHRDGQDHARG